METRRKEFQGKEIIDLLGVKEICQDRYRTSRGIKSTIGVYEAIKNIIEGNV